jgi:16S rRNA (adenine1518-N6/adenine1519-N6)-dimethyltransferase
LRVAVRPRKRFGQHFLVDRMAVAEIVEAIAPSPGERVVEIGPGTAALTAPLLERVGTMDAVEIDRDLAADLRRRFGERLRVHEGDALAFDFAALGDGEKNGLRLVGNLPYNISSPLLLHLREFTTQVVDQHFMLQKEVVDRIVAEPGGDMGRLTVLLQAWYEVLPLFDVPPEAFDPPPKVESSVIRMLPRAVPLARDAATLQALLAVGFGQRRKMIRNTLGKWFAARHPGFDIESAASRDARLAPFTESTRRPEEIGVEAWCALADALAGSAGIGAPAKHPGG